MKPRSRSKWRAANAGHAHNVKAQVGAVEWQRHLDALRQNRLAELSARAERLTEHRLMIWSDDGGATG